VNLAACWLHVKFLSHVEFTFLGVTLLLYAVLCGEKSIFVALSEKNSSILHVDRLAAKNLVSKFAVSASNCIAFLVMYLISGLTFSFLQFFSF